MTWKIWQQNEKNTMNPVTLLKEAFQILTTTLLSLLLPLSFLLLARLTTAQYLLDLNSYNTTLYQPFNQLFSIFLYTNPTLLHGLIAIVSVSSLLHASKGNDWVVTRPTESQEPVERSHIYTAWVLLCTLQVVVGLGIEGSIEVGVEGSNFGYEGFVLTRLMFFLGLLETMLHWSRTAVKPVVDDTVFGSTRKEKWVERVLMAACLSCLWWWRLKDEVEVLVVVAEVKRELWTNASVGDFVGWWLYYLIVTVGLVKVVKGVVCFGMVVVSKKKIEAKGGESFRNDENV